MQTELVTPGQEIKTGPGFLRGHGTYVVDGKLIASVAGVVQRVNKLVSVVPLKSRYTGQVGDVVVGRVTEIGQKRWSVDVGATQTGILMLSSVNLPGGEQRRRTYEDQLNMRTLFAEGDVVSAEIHQFWQDGAMSLHTRSRKYGKLKGGHLLKVPAFLMRRMKEHFHTLEGLDVDVILASNGFVWICPTPPEGSNMDLDDDDANDESKKEEEPPTETDQQVVIPEDARKAMARVRNAILALASASLEIWPAAILDTIADASKYNLAVHEMTDVDNLEKITASARSRRDATTAAQKDQRDEV